METKQKTPEAAQVQEPEVQEPVVEEPVVKEPVVKEPEAVTSPRRSRFDLAALRMSQDFDSNIPQTKILATVPVRKPDSQEWIRTHPSPEYRAEVGLIFFSEDRKTYLVDQTLHQLLAADVKRKLLVTTVTTQDVLFLWPVNLTMNGRSNTWNDTALVAAKTAERYWTRTLSNHKAGEYETYTVSEDVKIPAPDWKSVLQGKTFVDLLEIAFPGDLYIDTLEHLVVQKLLGRAA